MLKPRLAIRMFALGLTFAAGSMVAAQGYPTKPIRILTSEIGGGTDFAARQTAQAIAGLLGQPVIVDNRVQHIAAEIVTKATPDGYTLLVVGPSFWVGPVFRKANYDPVKGFSPISLLVNSPNILVVHPSVPVKSVKDLIDLAKAKPGTLNYAASSIGASGHLAAELFKYMAGVNIVMIPFKSSGAANISLISGQVQLAFSTPASITPHIKSGKVRGVAVTSAKPSTLMPELPTVAATVPGYEAGGATAMLAPPRTAEAIVTQLNRAVVQGLDQADVKERFFNVGVETVGSTPQQLAATIKSDMTRLGNLIRDAKLQLE